MDRIYLMLVLLIISCISLGIALWIINCKDLELAKKTNEKSLWEDEFNNLEKEFIKRDAERKEVIESLFRDNRNLREQLEKEKHKNHTHKVIFKNEHKDEYIDEEHFEYIDSIIDVKKDIQSYININNNLFKIEDIDCVIKLNK